MHNKLELLAPAGRWDVLEAVIASGADAVYLGSKKFNMRLHRSDYHFTEEQLAQAVALAHKHNVKLYVTINNLLSDAEIDELSLFLEFLDDICVDAIIVHDLGVLRKAREMNLKMALHSSTMMNTHSVLMAKELKELGISRIITSRDITLNQAKEIHEKCNIEVEYFVHGDMCSAQSSQCYASGVLFAKSSNRGECMKPCRWKYSLVDLQADDSVGGVTDGHFLAMNDLCLLQHIPSLVQAGICSFKIEGRMRDAKYLSEVVSIYRKAIDSYIAEPSFYYPDLKDIEHIYKTRVRNLSTSISFTQANHTTFDHSGDREPLFLSRFGKERELTSSELSNNPFPWQGIQRDKNHQIPHQCVEDCQTVTVGKGYNTHDVVAEEASLSGSEYTYKSEDVYDEFYQATNRPKSLSVKISTFDALKIAISEGADYVYLSGEISPRREQRWSLDLIKEAVEFALDRGKKFGLCTPRITTDREMVEVKRLLESVKEFGVDSIIVNNLGTLRLARDLGYKIFTDFSFNALNTHSISLLKDIGVSMFCVSVEMSLEDILKVTGNSQINSECIVHGQIPFMVLEHCLPALIVTKSNANGVCRQPCRHTDYALRDEKGETRPIEVDQYCKNHILFASDLCTLPYLSSFMESDIDYLRIEGQYYNNDLVGTLVKLYRKQMDMYTSNPCLTNAVTANEWKILTEKSPRKFGLGAYNHNIFQSKKTVDVIKSLN